MGEYCKPIPYIDEESKVFWKGAARREILIQKCSDCGKFRFYPRPICLECMSDKFDWVRANGTGTIHTFTVTYQNGMAGFRDELPYVWAVVELDEGVRMSTNIIGCDPKDVHIGMPVEVTFEYVSPEITLPKFRPRAR